MKKKNGLIIVLSILLAIQIGIAGFLLYGKLNHQEKTIENNNCKNGCPIEVTNNIKNKDYTKELIEILSNFGYELKPEEITIEQEMEKRFAFYCNDKQLGAFTIDSNKQINGIARCINEEGEVEWFYER